SRCPNTPSALTGPVTASLEPGTLRAAATASSGRSIPLVGMHAKYEHSPPTSSRSTSVIRASGSSSRRADTQASPVLPPPRITTSPPVISAPPVVSRGGEAGRGPRGLQPEDLGNSHAKRCKKASSRPQLPPRNPATAHPHRAPPQPTAHHRVHCVTLK